MLVGLAAEPHRLPDAGDGVLQVRVQLGGAPADDVIELVDLVGEVRGRVDQHRDREQRQEGQLPVEGEQDDRDPDERQRGHQQRLDPVDEDAFHVLDVVVDPVHDLAGGAVFVVADGEALEGREHLVAQVEDNALLQSVVKADPERGSDVLAGVREEQRGDRPGQQRMVPSDDDVVDDELPEEPGREKLDGGGRGRAREGQDGQPPVRLDETKDAKQGLQGKRVILSEAKNLDCGFN